MPERPSRSHDGVMGLPMVPLRDIVVFPHTMVPFVVGRKASLVAVDQALAGEKKLFRLIQIGIGRILGILNHDPTSILLALWFADRATFSSHLLPGLCSLMETAEPC